MKTKPEMLCAKVVQDVPYDKIANLLCSGMEGGINYWAKIIDYVKPDGYEAKGYTDLGGKIYKHIDYPLNPDCAVIIKDIEDGKEYRLDLPAIQKGLQTMADKCSRHWADFLNERDDATTGDVFIQCCLLGKIVYG